MAATTVTALQVLMRVADEIGEVQSAYVDDVSSTTIRAAGLSRGPETNYQYGIASIEGKGVRTVSSYYEADETIVVSSIFDPVAAVQDVISVYLWDPNKRARVQRAINQAIWLSYPFFYREVVIDLNNNVTSDGVTTWTVPALSSSVYEYDLPADLEKLSRVGLQTDGSVDPRWFAPMANWTVAGQPGAYVLRFNSRLTPFVDDGDGDSICLHYEAREPQFSTFTANDTTQLPLDYFSVAAAIYRRQELSNENVAQAQWAQQEAAQAVSRLGYFKKPLPRGPQYRWG